jgi:hypothetical protein
MLFACAFRKRADEVLGRLVVLLHQPCETIGGGLRIVDDRLIGLLGDSKTLLP